MTHSSTLADADRDGLGAGSPPTPATHLNNFDLVRLFGATQVAVWHAVAHLGLEGAVPGPASWLINRFPGVPIFFVVSGFLVSASLRRSTTLARYSWHRALRIYPALWACFAVTLVVVGALGGLTRAFLATTFWPWVLAQLTVGQFYNPAALRGIGVGVINGSLWTIPVELGFYVLLPLLFTMRRSRHFSVLLAIAAALSYTLWVELDSPVTVAGKLLGVSPFPHIWMFLAGVLAQLHKDRVLPLVRGRFLLWLALYLVVAFALRRAPTAVAGLGYLVLALAVLAAAYSRPSLAHRTLHGHDISYGVYIYHMLAVNVAVVLGFRGVTAALPAILVVTGLLASASWLIVERPALRLKGRVARG